MSRHVAPFGLALACLTSAVSFSPARADEPAAKPPVESAVFVSGQDGYHTYRIPSVIVTPKGTVLAFCEGRKSSRSDTGDIDLLLKRSTDGGSTFSAAASRLGRRAEHLRQSLPGGRSQDRRHLAAADPQPRAPIANRRSSTARARARAPSGSPRAPTTG